MTQLHKFCGAILAGGLSNRMGKDKANLKIHNQTLLERAIMLLKSCGASQVLISRNEDKYIKDLYPNAGPLGGIGSIIKQTDLNLLIVPVDMPLLTREILKQLIEDDNRACYFKGHPLPLYVTNNQRTTEYLSRTLETSNSNKSIMGLLDHIDAIPLDDVKDDLLINVNTPEQFAAISST